MSVKFSSAFGGVGSLFIDSAPLRNASILNTSGLNNYYVQLTSAYMSNVVYNVCTALGNNQVIISDGKTDTTYTIPDGYYTLGPHSQHDFVTEGLDKATWSGSPPLGIPAGSITLQLLYPASSDATFPYNIMPTQVNGVLQSTSNPILKVTIGGGYIVKKVPNIMGLDQYVGSSGLGSGAQKVYTTTTFGFRNTLNVCLNTQVLFGLDGMPLSSSVLSSPIAPAYATYGCGHMIISQNGYGASSPTNYETLGVSPEGDKTSPGIVLGTIPIPYTSQTGSVTYEGPVISIPSAGVFPFCKPPVTVTYMTISFCDDYGYLYFIDGQVECVIQITGT